MAVDGPQHKFSLNAAGDLSSDQFRLVKQTSSGVAVAGAGEPCVGVLYNKPDAAGKACEIAVGRVKVKAAGVIAAGAQFAADANGEAVAVAGGNSVAGMSMETAATAAGDVFSAQVYGGSAGQIDTDT